MVHTTKKQVLSIILAIVCVGLGIVIKSDKFIVDFESSDIQKINISLQNKENILEFWTDSILNSVTHNHTIDEFVTKNAKVLDQLYNQYGISIHLYNKDNEHLFWTDNSIAFDNSILQEEKPFVKLSNAQVYLLKKQTSQYKALGIILIRSNYSYENKFLQNEFHPSFNLKSDVKIIQGNKSDANAITDKNDNYLFTIKTEYKKPLNILYSIVFFLYSLAFFLLLFYIFEFFKDKQIAFWKFLIILITAFGVRFYFQFVLHPDFFTHIPLFKPQYFATSIFFPSLGDLLITSIIILIFVYVWVTKVKTPDISNAKYPYMFLWITIIHTYAVFAVYVLNCLIEDSSFYFELFDLTNLTVFSVIGYFIIFIIFLSYIMLVNRVVPVLKKYFKNYVPILLASSFSTIFLLACYFLDKEIDYSSYIFVFILTLLWVYISLQNTSNFAAITIIVSLFSVYIVKFINSKSFMKTFEESKVMAVNLAREKDPAAEIVIADVMQKCKQDTVLKKLLNPEDFNYNKFYTYFKNHYFSGYLKQYNLQLTICDRQDKLLVHQQTNGFYNCYFYFRQLINKEGYKTETKNLYYLQNNMGLTNYLFVVDLWLSDVNEKIKLFVELINKPNYEVLGYPELLLSKHTQTHYQHLIKTFAKYSDGKLLAEVGDFPYAFERSVYKHQQKEFDYFRYEGNDHFVYNYDKNSIIISKPTVTFFNKIISFTYLVLFCIVMLVLLSLMVNRFSNIIDIKFNIKNRIAVSITSILAFSMIFVAFATAMYINAQFERTQRKLLREKTQSVLVELENQMPEIKDIQEINRSEFNDLLIRFSNILYTDINIYDLKGQLYATSRQEIFDRNLTGNRMDAVAFRELFINKKARMVHNERIGNLQYYSAYIPFSNSNNELIAYLNLPYFSKEIELKQELSNLFVAVINLYAFLVIVSIFVAVYLAERLIEPLSLVQQRIRSLDLSKKNERIAYEGKDEIAELVTEYNRMLEELDKSARLLAKSERESAWREMAKQIAHEIKNPLTPMKLSIQLLNKAKQNNSPDFDKRLERTTKTLVEQIDSLSSIANAFSQFAKMPQKRLKRTNIIQPIVLTADLFEEYDNIDISLENRAGEEVFVLAENERIVQIFNNLIKNSIQAIPNKRKGKVNIFIDKDDKKVSIQVQDNGKGINPEIQHKLFEPNFTTKNSGTGLGLSIVKNIVEELNGDIYFESELNKGTSFFVSLPLIV